MKLDQLKHLIAEGTHRFATPANEHVLDRVLKELLWKADAYDALQTQFRLKGEQDHEANARPAGPTPFAGRVTDRSRT